MSFFLEEERWPSAPGLIAVSDEVEEEGVGRRPGPSFIADVEARGTTSPGRRIVIVSEAEMRIDEEAGVGVSDRCPSDGS